MKQKLQFFFIALLAGLVLSCDNNSTPEVKAAITFDEGQEQTITLPSVGGSSTIKFTSTKAWTASVVESTATWCSVLPKEGNPGNTSIVVTFTTNETYDSRNATIAIESEAIKKDVQITQTHPNTTLSITDPYFKAYLIANKEINTDGDDEISLNEAKAATEIYCASSNPSNEIASLEGIEHFTNLKVLDCDNNKLTTLDISKNIALETLNCNHNQLATISVSDNLALTNISCTNNQLTTLDISKNTALTNVNCSYNLLETLTLGSNTALKKLDCNYNKLGTLNVTECIALTELDFSSNQLTIIDISNNTELNELSCDLNQLESLNITTNIGLQDLSHNTNLITEIDISNNTVLVNYSATSNKLTTLDISNNTALKTLYCNFNQIGTITFGNNSALLEISCSHNLLTALDLSNSIALTKLECILNQITSLDLSKTNFGAPKSFLACSPMNNAENANVLATLTLKKGWEIQGIVPKPPVPIFLPSETNIVFVD